MVLHKEEYETSATYEEVGSPLYSNVIPKRHSDKGRKASSAASDMEARNKNLTEERDELKRKLDVLVLKQDSWRAERDNLTSMNSETEGRSRTISLERDELKKKLNTLAQPGWTLFRSRAYYISPTKKSWQESRAYCQSVDADLMIINSREEQVFANSFKLHMWIGLTDSETEGTWKWVDGSPLTTSYWGSQEPNGKTEENCGEIKSFTTERSWNDGTCSLQLNWICEMKFAQ
ncbi:CD209 antigen-like protein C isoform X2 [Fundulus heteroclitus]|uniref:CD209 antigen-like protein C isoform X2 n=1 Tax=Fundulus heteroclitus TaxID=8078 RepID=UPI00165C5A87|nr:CD209 antigen-like protein C isoform X2 [Fundulus heteroclitus]